jgi:hypothetical protein
MPRMSRVNRTCPAVGMSCVAGTYTLIDVPCGGAACGALCDITQGNAARLVGTCNTCVAAGNVCRTAGDCFDPSLGCGISLLDRGVELLGTVQLGFYGYHSLVTERRDELSED